MVPPTESLCFVAGELGKSGRNLEQIGAKFLGPNRFGVFFLTWRNAYLHVHDLGYIGKLEANLDSFKTALRPLKKIGNFGIFPKLSKLLRPKVWKIWKVGKFGKHTPPVETPLGNSPVFGAGQGK